MSVITTIEKLFHIKSASIALLLNFSEIGQICTSLLLTYFAGRGHRPRWIACGMFLFSLAAFGSVSPHFLFGSRLYNRGVSLKSDVQHANNNSLMSNWTDMKVTNVCLSSESFNNLSLSDPSELLAIIIERKFAWAEFLVAACDQNTNQEAENELKSVVLVILAVSLLGIGIGQTAIATLGIPYIDDNVKSKQSPLYMAITIGVRVLGPALGYYLGSLCIRQYVDLSTDVDHTDPNFIGAWWLGKCTRNSPSQECNWRKIKETRRQIKKSPDVSCIKFQTKQKRRIFWVRLVLVLLGLSGSEHKRNKCQNHKQDCAFFSGDPGGRKIRDFASWGVCIISNFLLIKGDQY